MSTEHRGHAAPKAKMVVRLWAIMMVMVLFGIAFMWYVQVSLFEENYVASAVIDIENRLAPIAEDLQTEDLANSDKLISYLSKSTNGKMMLVDAYGRLIAMYSNGHPLEIRDGEADNITWQKIKQSQEYQQTLGGGEYKKITESGGRIAAIEFGFPVTYNGEHASVFLYRSLNELYTVLDFNRRQLVTLTVVLTGISALLAALLSRQFVKPIHSIKQAVDALAEGNLDEQPPLKREDELGDLSASVTQLGQALRRVDVLRQEVIANVSHELRSPLALIVGYGEMVRDVSWRDDTARSENLNLIIREARRLSEMVDDIMDYSQFQAGFIQLKKDRYNLYDIVESITTLCETNAGEYGVKMVFESYSDDISVEVDALKISQVMRNLLYNAINHTSDGQTITVQIKKEGHSARVSVANPGSPIPEDERKTIWERYRRSQQSGGRRQGTGIGLSIVGTILGAHHIDHGVDCEDGLIIFWFTCPVEDC